MNARDVALLLLFGFAFWIAGTVYYEFRGATVLETTELRYWLNFLLSPLFSAIVCILLLRARHIPPSAWASAGLLLALPGMLGEAALLSHFSSLMPRLQPSSAGRYGAFLFAAYAVFLAVAEIVTLKADR